MPNAKAKVSRSQPGAFLGEQDASELPETDQHRRQGGRNRDLDDQGDEQQLGGGEGSVFHGLESPPRRQETEKHGGFADFRSVLTSTIAVVARGVKRTSAVKVL